MRAYEEHNLDVVANYIHMIFWYESLCISIKFVPGAIDYLKNIHSSIDFSYPKHSKYILEVIEKLSTYQTFK